MTDSATPTGGAEVSARADTSASPVDRLKSFFGAEEAPGPAAEAATESEAPAQTGAEEKPQPAKKAAAEDEPTEDAATEAEPVELSTLDELAEALTDQGYNLDRLLDLEAKVKIDGKEGKARLRDLIKSHQLEGHLNQKLMTHAEERKAFEAERATKTREQADKLLRMDAGLQTLERALAGEFAAVDWQGLQQTDPARFNAEYIAYQQRYAQYQGIAQQIAQEQQKAQSEMAAQQQSYLQEQQTLLQAKVPEWADEARRKQDFAAMAPVLNKAYGFSQEELGVITDHRLAMAMRDLAKYHQLMSDKPSVLKKVREAPKLLKPGAPQNRVNAEAEARQKAVLQLRKSGKASDAKQVLKHIFSS